MVEMGGAIGGTTWEDDYVSLGSYRDCYADLRDNLNRDPSSLSDSLDSMGFPSASASGKVAYGPPEESPRSVRMMSKLDREQVLLNVGSTPPLAVGENERFEVAGDASSTRLDASEEPVGMAQIRVAVRLRPWSANRVVRRRSLSFLQEAARGWDLEDGKTLVSKDKLCTTNNISFTFDDVFDELASTATVYEKVTKPMLEAAMEGRHATVLTYGPSASGKTYTMQGRGDKQGMTQMAVDDLFHCIERSHDREYTVRAEYFEIYGEQVRDLLVEPSARGCCTASSRTGRSPLKQQHLLRIRDDPNGNTILTAHKEAVGNAEDIVQVLKRGNKQRALGATSLNAYSSRSHTILRLTLEDRKGQTPSSVINFVDLAGSDCDSTSRSSATRRRRSNSTQSLVALSRVMDALSLPKDLRPKHIAYRDSKLTRILQPHLSGNAYVSILCCVSPSNMDVDETRSALKFAASARQVKVFPVVNQVVDEISILTNMQAELAKTKVALRDLRSCVSDFSSTSRTESQCSSLRNSRSSSPQVLSLVASKDLSDVSSEVVLGDGMDVIAGILPISDDSTEKSRSSPVSDVPVREVLVKAESISAMDSFSNGKISRLDDAAARVKLLEAKLEATDSLFATLFPDFEAIKRCKTEAKHINLESE